MKRFIAFLLSAWLLQSTPAAFATVDLIEVLEQASVSDAAFQAAQAKYFATTQNVPIALSALLPFVSATGTSLYNVQSAQFNDPTFSTTAESQDLSKYNTNTVQVNLQQTLFNYTQWLKFQQSKTTVKAADAEFIAAAQDLISRTAQAYFNVLFTEDILRYVDAEKKAVYEQLDQVTQQFKVGVVAITGVYQAQAQYDSILAEEITAQNNIVNAKEDLRTITGIYYDSLANLEAMIPLQKPLPSDPEKWVASAIKYNWIALADRYKALVAKEQIGVSQSGHLPTVNAVGSYNSYRTGTNPGGQFNNELSNVGVQLNLPVFQGGLVVAQTRQAEFAYRQAFEQADQTLRTVMTDTRKSYNNVIAGISRIEADRKAIISNASSVRSTIEAYNVGAQTILDILIAQTDLFDAQQQYARDEYAYINAIIQLKQDAGTLSFSDILQLNHWLTKSKRSYHEMTADDLTRESNALLKKLQDEDNKALSKKDALKKDLNKTVTASTTTDAASVIPSL